jgi:hypothetical protein
VNILTKTLVLGFLFLCAVSVNAQALNVVTLVSQSSPQASKRVPHYICFAEQGRPCGKRPPDLLYGFMHAGEDLDWFMVGTQAPVRTGILNLGPHRWEDKIGLPSLEPYPKLKPGETREATVDFASATEETATGNSSSMSVVREEISRRSFMKPPNLKILRTSSEIVKVIEGHMYLLRVRDDVHDFYVILRVDKVVPGKSVRLSWRHFGTP